MAVVSAEDWAGALAEAAEEDDVVSSAEVAGKKSKKGVSPEAPFFYEACPPDFTNAFYKV